MLAAWAWDDVVPLLADRGYAVTALTLPGLEPDHPARGDVTLDHHAEAIAAALDRRAARRVLVVHTGAALPGTMLLDRHADLVDHVVFVDTAPVRDGYQVDAEFEGPEFPLSAAWESEMADGSMRDLTDEQLQTFVTGLPAGRGGPSAVRCGYRTRLGSPRRAPVCTACG